MSHILLLYIQGEVNSPHDVLVQSFAAEKNHEPSPRLFTSYHGYQVLYYDDNYHVTHMDHEINSREDHLQLKQSCIDEKETTHLPPCSSYPDDHEIYKCLMLGIPVEMPQEVNDEHPSRAYLPHFRFI
jgi:hypothetical protein